MFELADAFGDLRLLVIAALQTRLDFHHHPIFMPRIMSSAIEDGASHLIAGTHRTAQVYPFTQTYNYGCT